MTDSSAALFDVDGNVNDVVFESFDVLRFVVFGFDIFELILLVLGPNQSNFNSLPPLFQNKLARLLPEYLPV